MSTPTILADVSLLGARLRHWPGRATIASGEIVIRLSLPTDGGGDLAALSVGPADDVHDTQAVFPADELEGVLLRLLDRVHRRHELIERAGIQEEDQEAPVTAYLEPGEEVVL